MFSNIRVGRQLGWAFGLVVALVLVLALTAWSRILAIHGDFESLVDTTLPALTALGDVNDKLQAVRISELRHLSTLNMPAKDREELVVKAAAKDFDVALARYTTVGADLVDPALHQEMLAAMAQYHGMRGTFFQMSNSAAGAEEERAVEASWGKHTQQEMQAESFHASPFFTPSKHGTISLGGRLPARLALNIISAQVQPKTR